MNPTLYRNQTHTGKTTWHASEKDARHYVRCELLRGAPPFAEIAKPHQVPTTKKRLAAFLNSLAG